MNVTTSHTATAVRTLWWAIACMVVGLAACTGSPRGNALHDRLEYDGIDLSSHQGLVDWDKVVADDKIQFVYIKATEGATYHSPHHDFNVRHAREKGLPVGSYHYFTTTAPVEAQVENFTRHATPDTQDLLPMIDIEDIGTFTRSQLIDSVLYMARRLEAIYGKRPVIYSTAKFYNTYLAPQLNDYPLYLGRYSNTEPYVDWRGRYTVWQYSEQGVVAGISRYVDMCRFHPDASLEDLKLH